MRVVTAAILLLAAATAACDRRDAPSVATRDQGAPVAAATTLPTDAPKEAPPAAPAAAVGAAALAPPPAAALDSPEPPTAPAVTWREVTIPSGTSLPVILDTPVASNTSRVEAPVEAHLSRAVVVNGVTVIPRGSRVEGVITAATRAAKVKGRASIAMRFDTLKAADGDEPYAIETSPISRRAEATKKDDTVKILAPAVGGAIIGRIVGGRKGAAIGAGTGAGAGTAVVMSTRGKEVSLAKGAALTLKLTRPLVVRVRS